VVPFQGLMQTLQSALFPMVFSNQPNSSVIRQVNEMMTITSARKGMPMIFIVQGM
jgi:hypothetical protein